MTNCQKTMQPFVTI